MRINQPGKRFAAAVVVWDLIAGREMHRVNLPYPGAALAFSPDSKTLVASPGRQSEAVNPEGDPEEKILEAAENCPVSAIFVEDAETGERLFP